MSTALFNIQLNADKTLVSRGAKTQCILEIRIQAPGASEQETRPALNLAIVLDRSGSMQGVKLEYVKQAACHVLDQLTERDYVSIVVYDDLVHTLAPSTQVTHGNRFELKQLVNRLQSGNMTNLEGGWLTGCKQIARSATERSINRTLLLTDGLANVGETDLEVLAAHALELYKDAIATSTFGVGEGFNEHLLEAMANRGGGNFYYIASPRQIPEIFQKEFNDLVGIAARKVEIKLDLPSTVEWHILGGWTAEYKAGQLHIYVGDMLFEKQQDIYLQLQVPPNQSPSELGLSAKAYGKGKDNEVLESTGKLAFQYAMQKEVDDAPQDQDLMKRFSMVELADSANEALKLERRGERIAAQQMLRDSLNRNRPHVSAPDAMLYHQMGERMRNGMTEADRKSSHWESYNRKRQKREEEEK